MFDLELKRCFEKTYFSLEMSNLTSKNNFPAYIRDHEIGFSDFWFFDPSYSIVLRPSIHELRPGVRPSICPVRSGVVLRSVFFDRASSLDPSCSIEFRPSIHELRSDVLLKTVPSIRTATRSGPEYGSEDGNVCTKYVSRPSIGW